MKKILLDRQIGRPHSCSIVVTTECMLRCKMCYMWRSKSEPRQISNSDWLRFIDSLAGFLDGPKELVFSGGEPLIKDDIFDLINFAKQREFKTIMPTNGYLIDKEMARRIADSGLDDIFISLDSFNEDTHDFLRGIRGTFKRIMNAFEYLRSYASDLHIGVITVISGRNFTEVICVTEWVKEYQLADGIYFQAVAKPFFASVDDDWYKNQEYSYLWPQDINDINHVLDKLIELKRSGYPIYNCASQLELFKSYFAEPNKRARNSACNMGDYTINIDPNGEILLCCFMKPIGNIKNSDIKQIWFSELASQRRQQMYRCQKNCNNFVNCFFKEETS